MKTPVADDQTNLWADPNLLETLPQWILAGHGLQAQHQHRYSVKPPRLNEYSRSPDFSEDLNNSSLLRTAHTLSRLCTVYDNLVASGNWYDPSLRRLERAIETRSRFWFARRDIDKLQQGFDRFDFRDWDKYVIAKLDFHERFFEFDPKGYQEIYGTTITSLYNLEYLSAFLQLKVATMGAQLEAKAARFLAQRWLGAPLDEIENTIRKLVFDFDWGTPEDPTRFILTERELKLFFHDE